MDLDPIGTGMKLATLAGVAAACIGLAAPDVADRARRRCAAVAAGGVVLMFGNALVAVDALGILVDVAYLAVASAVSYQALRDRRPGGLPTPEEALRMPLEQPPAAAPPAARAPAPHRVAGSAPPARARLGLPPATSPRPGPPRG